MCFMLLLLLIYTRTLLIYLFNTKLEERLFYLQAGAKLVNVKGIGTGEELDLFSAFFGKRRRSL